MEIGIATAKINLSQKMTRFKGLKNWIWSITFFDTSSTNFSNLILKFSKDKKIAKKRKEGIKSNFRQIGIKNGSLVGVLFNRKNHEVIAIGSSGKKLWVSIKDNYDLKELNLDSITSIKFFFD